MSPRAASRLESLGFTPVYDYVAGKADWGSFGLPLEGRRPSSTRAGAHARTDVPACRPDDRMTEVRERVRAAGWDTSPTSTGSFSADSGEPHSAAMTIVPSTRR
jgi:hypothetical protein